MGTRHWTQSYADIPAEIDADRYASMVDLLDAALERHASRPAFKAFGQTLNYADVDRLSRSFASYLQNKLGVRQGDRVAVMMPNLLAFPVTLLGIMRAGAVQVNVNPLYTPRELEHQLNDAGVETIVVFSGSTPTLAEVRANTGLKTVITVAVGDASGATLPSPPVDALLGESVSFAEALAQGGGLPLQPVALTGDDLLFLQYTGGTTGLSKGAALSHRNLVANNEIEAVATAFPGVMECACIGVPDEKTGEAVKLFIVKAQGATLSEAEVVAFCRKELTGYKVPKLVRFVNALPKSTVGKILRRELRDVK